MHQFTTSTVHSLRSLHSADCASEPENKVNQMSNAQESSTAACPFLYTTDPSFDFESRLVSNQDKSRRQDCGKFSQLQSVTIDILQPEQVHLSKCTCHLLNLSHAVRMYLKIAHQNETRLCRSRIDAWGYRGAERGIAPRHGPPELEVPAATAHPRHGTTAN